DPPAPPGVEPNVLPPGAPAPSTRAPPGAGADVWLPEETGCFAQPVRTTTSISPARARDLNMTTLRFRDCRRVPRRDPNTFSCYTVGGCGFPRVFPGPRTSIYGSW